MFTQALTYIGIFAIIRFFLQNCLTIYQGFRAFILGKKINLREKYGEWAIVTGGTDGIGKGYALELARRGLNIILIARNENKLKSVREEIVTKYNVDVRTVKADFSETDIYDGIMDDIRGLDIGLLVNNVGIAYTYPMLFGEISVQELEEIINVNIHSAIMMSHAILPKMLEKKRGAIVNLSSMSVYQPVPYLSLYSSSKIFVNQLSETLRSEYENKGITVQTVTPCYVSTKINDFSPELQEVGLFIPDAVTFASKAVDTIGIIDYTTGYFPHAIQYCAAMAIPIWLRTIIGGIRYKNLRKTYFKSINK